MLRKLLITLAFLTAFISTAVAQQKLQGYCERGGQVVTTDGRNSTTKVQQTYPSCTVTVYLTGTTTLASIYSDYSSTPKSNPFTADTDGYWWFIAASGQYDVRFSGGGIPSPFTRSGLWIATGGGGGGGVSSVGLSLPASLFSVSGSPVTSSGTLAGSLITQSANLVFAGPTSGGAATPTFRALVTADLPAGTIATDVMRVQNVKEGYGCAGDGVTNDTTCVANAISAANASTTKKIVYFPEGTYLLTSGVSPPAGVELRGSGPNSIITTASTIDVLTVTGNNVIISNLKINGGRRGIVINTGLSNVQIRKVTFTGITAHTASIPTAAVYLAGQNSDIWVEDSIFTGNGNLSAADDGADFMAAASATPFHNRIHFLRNTITGGFSRFSVAMFDTFDPDILGNYIDQNNQIAASTPSDISGYGIVVYSTSNTGVIKRPRIIGNLVTTSAGSGIYLVSTFGAVIEGNILRDTCKQQLDTSLPVGAISLNVGNGATVVGNTIEKTTTGNGIAVTDNYNTTTLTSGIIAGDTSLTVGSTLLFGSIGDKVTLGIDSELLACTVSSTTVFNSCSRGLYGTTAASHSSLATITSRGPSGITIGKNTLKQIAGNAAINFRNTCDGCVVDGNEVAQSTTGILLTTGITLRNARLTNNTFDQITGQGINLETTNDTQIGFNRVIQTSAQGILISAGSRNAIVGNHVSSAGAAGLELGASTATTLVTANEITSSPTGVSDIGTGNVYDETNRVLGNTTNTSFSASKLSQLIDLTGATPSISNGRYFRFNNGSPTTVTNLTGGDELHPWVVLTTANSNTTVAGGGAFVLNGNNNFAMSTDDVLVLYWNNGWHEAGRQTSTNPVAASRFYCGTSTYGAEFECVKAASSVRTILESTTSTAFSRSQLRNGSVTLTMDLLNSAYPSNVLTGAATGTSGNIYTEGAIGLNIGTNGVLRQSWSSTGVWSVILGSDATGDLFYKSTSSTVSRLAIGSAGQCLVVSGGLPVWGSCSGASGITGTIASPQVAYGTGANTIGGAAGFTFDGTSKVTLGVAGTSVGAIDFKNATSGTITMQPVTGALGTVTLSLPTATDTLVGKATTDTFTNKTLTSSTNVLGGVTMTLGSDANGDIYTRSGGVLTRIGIGANGTILTSNGTSASWQVPATTTWDVIGNPIANQTLSMSTFTTAHNYTTGLLSYNWSGNTSTSSAFTLTHSNTTATGYLLDVGATSASSNIKPLVVRAKNAIALNTDAFGDFTFQPVAQTSGSPTIFTITGPAHTGATAGTEVNDINFNLNRTVTFATGSLGTNRSVRFQAPTLAAAASSTITDAINVDITSPTAGANVTITRSTALRVKPTNAADHGIWTDGTVSYTGDAFAAGLSGTKLVRMVGSGGSMNVVLAANGALATNATDGFTYLPSSAGTPTGVPTSYSGSVPVEIDTTNSKFYGYFGGSWVNLSGAGGTPAGSTGDYQYNNGGAFGAAVTSQGSNGRVTVTPLAVSSGVSSYWRTLTPADTSLTASTESIGIQFGGNTSAATVTRQWATGALTTQRENVFVAPTYAFVGASTLTTAITLDASSPIAGTNATLTNSYAGRFNASAAGHVALVANSAASPTANIFQTQINGSTTGTFVVTSTGAPSSPGAGGSTSERFGATSTTTSTGATAIGYGATADAAGTALGHLASATGLYAVAIGRSAGPSAVVASSTNSVAIGLANVTHQASVALNAASTAANQFLVGGPGQAITNVFFGEGVTDGTPLSYTINGTGGSGSNIAGADIKLYPGIGTGTGATGSLFLQFARPGSSGSSANTLSDSIKLAYTTDTLTFTWRIKTSTTAETDAASIAGTWITNTHASRTSALLFSTVNTAGALSNVFSIEANQYYGTRATQSSTGSVTVDFAGGNTIEVTMTGNITSLSFLNLRAGAIYSLSFIQDATGGRTLSVPSTLKVAGGSYSPTSAANARDGLICSSDGTNLYCLKGADIK